MVVNNMYKSILVTGGAGFIGSYLVKAMIAAGSKVTVLDDLSSGNLGNLDPIQSAKNLSVVQGSITDPKLVGELVAQNDFVFHLAAVVGVKAVLDDPIRTINVNVLGSHNVIGSSSLYKKPIFVASSSEVYGKKLEVPYSEGDDSLLGGTDSPRWIYSLAKQLDEFYSKALFAKHSHKVVIGRFFNTVGPRQNSNYGMVIPKFVMSALKNEDLTVFDDGTQKRCFAHVEDVVDAVLRISLRESQWGESFNIGSSQEISIKNLAEKVIEMTSSRSRVRYVSSKEVYGVHFDEPKSRAPDMQKLGRILGPTKFRGIDEILNEVINFEKKRIAT